MQPTSLLSIFANTIVPIFVLAGIGFWLARYQRVDAKTISTLTFNVLSPCLVFNTLVTSTLSPDEFGRMALFTFCVIVAAGVVALIVSLPLRLDRVEANAFLIVAMFANAGNYGLPLVFFAFGQEALTRATVYVVIHVILLYSIGILLASSGKSGWRRALGTVVRVPHLYAIVAAALIVFTHTPVPDVLMRPIGLLNQAALTMMVLLMGMQLERATMPTRPSLVGVAASIRLVILPVLALALAALFNLTGADRQAAVLEASMPAAVMVSVLAVQFQTAPDFVTAVVFITTVLSPVTLTLLIAWLQ